MKRNNQRGAQRQHSLQALAKENRSITGTIAAMMGAAGASLNGMFGKGGFDDFVKPPRNHYNRSKYKPHQGAQEKARRIRQGLAGLNCDKGV